MEAIGNYWFFWLLYLLAAGIFTAVFWRATRFSHASWTSYSLRAVAIALIFTPWYSNPQDSGMAPALMIATLDAITAGGAAAYRSFVPLVLAIIFGLLVAGALSFAQKRRDKLLINNNSLKNKPKVSQQ
tara:strand:+ start:131 stop:517 length:387 start_codon:yes stop_codon:yes gene_type:complete